MTPAEVPRQFEREYGCTEADWLRWLPGAVRDCPLELPQPGQAQIGLPQGGLTLHWVVLPPRRIALISMPRMQVVFSFGDTSELQRQIFLRYFDLFMQRGGG